MCKPEWLSFCMVHIKLVVGKYSNHMDPMGFVFVGQGRSHLLFFMFRSGGLKNTSERYPPEVQQLVP